MTSGDFQLEPNSRLGRLIGYADRAFADGEVSTMDDTYVVACRLATGPLGAMLSADHVGRLLAADRVSLAWKRCAEYLAGSDTPSAALRLRHAEVLSRVGAHDEAARVAADVRAEFTANPSAASGDDWARLHRVDGLAHADRGEHDQAERHLTTAALMFREAGVPAAAHVVEGDLRLLAVRRGDSVTAQGPPETVAERLAAAACLRAQWRYGAAYDVLVRADTPDLDTALRLPVLAELCRLRRLLRYEHHVDPLLERLADAASTSPDPNADWIVRDLRLQEPDLATDAPDRIDLAIQYARKLTLANRLTEAEQLLVRSHRTTMRRADAAAGQLAMGELRLTWFDRLARETDLNKAIRHLTAAVRHTEADEALVETRILALRTLGRAYYNHARLPDRPRATDNPDQRASECWSEAHRLEERVAARQDDKDRLRILLAAVDELDERVRAAGAAIERGGGAAAAHMVAVLESAKYVTALDDVRDLPPSHDPAAAWRWVTGYSRDLARQQAIWLLYQTVDQVHHVLLGNGLLEHCVVRCSRVEFGRTVDEFAAWTSPALLERGVRDGQVDRLLAAMSHGIAAADVVALLPERITRIAVMAGGELAEVPFAALPVPGSPGWLGHRYALSDLPSLSARRSLGIRSANQRGDRSLLLRSPNPKHRKPAPLARRQELGDPATVDRLAAELATGRYRWLRIDCDGEHDPAQPDMSWLRLAAGTDGRLRADMLGRPDLRRCGTVILGACESGMAQRRGRDERVGFVRAAFRAGAAAVVAARWAGEDTAAAWVLDRFGQYLRYLPRDVALHRAQVDLCAIEPELSHPARWGCWTLYGDPGWQTGAWPLHRVVRREIDRFRHHHRRSGVLPDQR